MAVTGYTNVLFIGGPIDGERRSVQVNVHGYLPNRIEVQLSGNREYISPVTGLPQVEFITKCYLLMNAKTTFYAYETMDADEALALLIARYPLPLPESAK